MKTYMANPDKIERKWYVVDAEGCTLGRLASEVAKVLRGKNKPEFTPHIDTGDYVIVINAKDGPALNADLVLMPGRIQPPVIRLAGPLKGPFGPFSFLANLKRRTSADMHAQPPDGQPFRFFLPDSR